MHSRNNKAGYLIGQGLSPSEAVKEVGMVVEGINAIPAAVKLAEKYDVDMPIVFGVNDIINNGVKPVDAVNMLFNRELKMEVPMTFKD
jgi:glycerol-3-phosphate dehydrogenase (NAD(P)+)